MTKDETTTGEAVAGGREFDLEERTARFGAAAIRFCRKVPVDAVTCRLIPQLVAAAASVGANYREANDAESPRDFYHKIGLCRKESKETKHFIRLLIVAVPALRADGAPLWREVKELNLIFGSIIRRRRAAAP